MGVSKVNYGNRTLIDLTSDTVLSTSLLSGITAHAADGSQINGTLVIQHYYTGSGTPSASLGVDGDIYLEVVT